MKEYVLDDRFKKDDRKKSFDSLEEDLMVIEETNLGIESIAQVDLYNSQLPNYSPLINSEFLSMNHRNNFSDEHSDSNNGIITFEMTLPKFAIYTLESSMCQFAVKISHRDRDRKHSERQGLEIVDFEFNQPQFPSFLEQDIRKSIKLVDERYKFRNPFSETIFEFDSLFHGIIPNETKDNIRIARRIFIVKDVNISPYSA